MLFFIASIFNCFILVCVYFLLLTCYNQTWTFTTDHEWTPWSYRPGARNHTGSNYSNILIAWTASLSNIFPSKFIKHLEFQVFSPVLINRTATRYSMAGARDNSSMFIKSVATIFWIASTESRKVTVKVWVKLWTWFWAKRGLYSGSRVFVWLLGIYLACV